MPKAKLSENVIHLGQAITNADDGVVVTLVESIGNDQTEISHIVDALPVHQVVPFLQLIENLLNAEAIKDLRLWIIWLNTIFKSHSTYLSSISDLDAKISALTEWMRSRVQNLDKLLQMQGKLELITQQMRQTAEVINIIDSEPIMTFEE